MSRKLVTIRTVSEVNPIEGADSIECLTVEGWKVVSQKGNFKPGDPCVYFEIDSLLPDGNPLWQDLVDKSSRVFEGVKGHVLRTIKLRGQVSQGFCIPLHKFPSIMEDIKQEYFLYFPTFDTEERVYLTRITEQRSVSEARYIKTDAFTRYRDFDWAEHLGVLKYEPPIPAELAGLVKGLFPSFIKKTDQERCQNLANEIFADLDAKYEVTIKLDGTSMTAYHDPEGDGGVCSRNLEFKTGTIDAAHGKIFENEDNTMVKIVRESGLAGFLKYNQDFAIQGELMGPGIQGNREQLKAPIFFIFDIFNMKTGEYVGDEQRAEILRNGAGDQQGMINPQFVNHVPILHRSISLRELGITNVDELLQFAEGKSFKHDVREGVVFKRADGKFSFKAISNRFLLKQKD